MLEILKPEYYEKDVFSIDYNRLLQKGIKFLVFDIDNTLVIWRSTEADERVKKLFKRLIEMGFTVGILSNSSAERVKRFIGEIDIKTCPYGRKPMKIGFRGIVKAMKANTTNACMIGDQIFTDILGGNRIGMHTILVDPIGKEEFITTKWLRKIDGKLRRKIINKGELSKIE